MEAKEMGLQVTRDEEDVSFVSFDCNNVAAMLDYTTRFSLWQVKMRAILTQSSDLDEALDGFGKKDAKTWTDDEKRKDLYEALQQREKMKSMVQAEGSSSKAEALQVRGRTENRNNNYNRDKSKTEVAQSPRDEMLRVFGCTAYAHVDNGKLEPRAVKCVFLGYGSGVKAYKGLAWVEHVEEKENDVAENDNTVVQHSPPVLQQTNSSIAADRPRRNKGPRPRLIEECNLVAHALSCAEQVEHGTEPATYTEAVASVDRVKWISAMQEEMQSLDKNGTWDVVPLPKQKKVVRCKWIFKRKEGLSPSEPPRFKARLVAKGFSQIPGIDYNDVFSPVVKHSSIRAFFGIVAMRDLELEQLDVKTAFLHGELEEEIYMDQPEGFVVPGKEDLVCKLKRSLYGLKQSPRQWYKRFDSFMLAHEFKRSKYDSCVYIKFVNGSPIYLLLYVDDMLIAAKSKKEITILKAQLSSEFEMKDLGAAKKILDQMFHERTKHIDIKYHYIRDIVAKGKLKGPRAIMREGEVMRGFVAGTATM
ncbi:hypothetical protein QYE76_001691 [Lolium multiflorum]|uniref:Uncharacterized protein n=1 Tax=Lolium multiflorum TaxID=4521 RepID=A0AAD8VZX7_LOLMU|nr:hypothetical protein QYE76_001691 [Lolium multiflorum]